MTGERNFSQTAELIQNANSILLSTHRQCDGDGLGAELAFYYALKNAGKKVEIVNVDETPKKYRFLKAEQIVQSFQQLKKLSRQYDLCLIFDTNDKRLLSPLYEEIEKNCARIAFIDHHPALKRGPQPTAESYIDTTAASTGEIAYQLLKKIQAPFDLSVASALYTSITFDTQLYRFIRGSANSHLIAAELLKFPVDTETVHRHLFAHQTPQKIAFLAKALGQIEYHCDEKLALLKLKNSDLISHKIELDDTRDIVDMIMNIECIEVALLVREDGLNVYKVSLRSKGQVPVLPLAEKLGGGGHSFAAGASVKDSFEQIKKIAISEIDQLLKKQAG